jgi:type VI secretion system protein ImpK
MTATMEFAAPSSPAAPQRRGQLALSLQEAFTVAVRLRSNRQVAADAQSFRAHIKQLLAGADRDARGAGYDGASVKLAVYAFIAFLDESVLNSSQPMFAEWPRQPLQEEVFGDHMAGETFFRYLQELLGRQDSEETADILEVFQLCMLLGFRGRYAAQPGELNALMSQVQSKISRIRGESRRLSPTWPLPEGEAPPAARDPWLRRLGLAAAGTLALALILFLAYSLFLHSGITDVRALVARLGR